jgi:mannose-6-phosphate isomerase-like protein (cupin superfamily)
MAGEIFDFHGTSMQIHLNSIETGGSYALIEMHHRANVGPALHIHPRGPESFFVLDGEYTFVRGSETLLAGAGQAVVVPAGIAHRYTVGPNGGRALVITPPQLDEYFVRIAELLRALPAPSLEEEFAVAAAFGQDFVERQGHWAGS